MKSLKWRSVQTPVARTGCLTGALLLAVSAHGLAQENKSPAPRPPTTSAPKPTALTHPNNPELWDVDQMMEEAVQKISERYHLNKDQEAYTRLLLIQRTRAFLDVHDKDVRELLRESIDLKNGVKSPTPENFQKWATRAAPIYEAARSAIWDGNMEWRAILDKEQIKTHDADLAQMDTNFKQVSKLLDTWKGGNAPTALAKSPQQPGDPNAPQGPNVQTRVSEPQQPVLQRVPEDSWLAYVNRFVQVYKLDDKQAISARDKIYKDLRDDANRYRESRKKDFAELDQPAPAGGSTKEQNEQRARLERPLHEMFVQLDQRLKRLPNSTQLAGADPQELRQLETWYRLLAGPLAPKSTSSEGGIHNRPDAGAPTESSEDSPSPTTQPAAATTQTSD